MVSIRNEGSGGFLLEAMVQYILENSRKNSRALVVKAERKKPEMHKNYGNDNPPAPAQFKFQNGVGRLESPRNLRTSDPGNFLPVLGNIGRGVIQLASHHHSSHLPFSTALLYTKSDIGALCSQPPNFWGLSSRKRGSPTLMTFVFPKKLIGSAPIRSTEQCFPLRYIPKRENRENNRPF